MFVTFCLPAFELTYAPAPTRLACTFTDTREALWVGELHRQSLIDLGVSGFRPVPEPDPGSLPRGPFRDADPDHRPAFRDDAGDEP